MILLSILFTLLVDLVPVGDAFLKPLQKRDSILVADQVKYGVTLRDIEPGIGVSLPDFKQVSNDTLVVVRDWQIDTLQRKKARQGKPFDAELFVVLAPFEEGEYQLPDIPVVIIKDDVCDTVLYSGLKMDVKTMPVDTATFQIHEIKGQIEYPVTAEEVASFLLKGTGLILIICIVAAIIILIIVLFTRKSHQEQKPKERADVVALRDLEGYRSDKYWAAERQKEFYSGVTDVLKTYIDERFAVDAPEMTTAELFDALKGREDVSKELYSEMKLMFERADFVKFAKYVASEDENAHVLPLSIRFVTSTAMPAEEEKEVQ